MEKVDLKETLEEMGYELEEVVEDRTLNIMGEFNEDMLAMTYEFVKNLREDDEWININISSRGGEAEVLFAIVDVLRSTGRKLSARVNGFAYSSALGLLCACDKRDMGDMSMLMYHQCSYGYEHSIGGHEKYLREAKKTQSKYDSLILGATNLTIKDLNKVKNDDWYIDKKLATDIGLINC